MARLKELSSPEERWGASGPAGSSGAGRLRRTAQERIATDVIPALILLAWYLASFRAPEYVLPNPLSVILLTLQLLADPALFHHTYISLGRVIAAVLIALLLGSSLVLLARYAPLARGFIVRRLLPFLNAFPTLGWAILAVYWFGVSDPSAIFVEVAILLPFSMITMWEGMKALDEETLEMAWSFTRNRWIILRKVIFPLLLPYIFAVLRISYGVAWKVALIAELFGSSVGLGYLLNYSRNQFNSPMLFGTILVIIVLVYLMDRLGFEPLERRMMKYRAEAQAGPPHV
ncbi:MAG: ABC transporter permease [Deltaproteobacteria bacterium]|nr:ABC transporter permease [Deltaproteobacteria bacterium]